MTAPLKIAYLFQSIGFRFSEPFAVQLHIYHLVRGLQQAGHIASILLLERKAVIHTEDLAAARRDELTFGKLGLTGTALYKLVEGGIRRIHTLLHLPYLALFDSHRMYDACRHNLQGCDLIHERYNLMSLGGALASRRLGIPYVLEVNADLLTEREYQGTPEQGLRRWFAVRSTQYAFKTARKIIAVSSHLKDHLVNQWSIDPGKVVVLPNAADTEAFGRHYDVEPIRRQLGLTTEPVVMFVGGFYAWHDLPLLIDSFAMVLHDVPDARLILVGGGRTEPEIRQKIRENGLQHAVILAGKVDHSQVPAMLAAADVAVAPNIPFFSGHGGSPLKLYEYMAAGKAIVATKTGQVGEVIQDGHNGLLAEPGDVDGFADGLRTLLTNPKKRKRIGQVARDEAVSRHSWQHYAERLKGIYAEAMVDSSKSSEIPGS